MTLSRSRSGGQGPSDAQATPPGGFRRSVVRLDRHPPVPGRTECLVQVLDGVRPANTPPIRVDLRPGRRFRYFGGGYCVAQQLLIDVERKPFAEIVRERVLRPLGTDHSTFESASRSAVCSAPPATDSMARGCRAGGIAIRNSRPRGSGRRPPTWLAWRSRWGLHSVARRAACSPRRRRERCSSSRSRALRGLAGESRARGDRLASNTPATPKGTAVP